MAYRTFKNKKERLSMCKSHNKYMFTFRMVQSELITPIHVSLDLFFLNSFLNRGMCFIILPSDYLEVQNVLRNLDS